MQSSATVSRTDRPTMDYRPFIAAQHEKVGFRTYLDPLCQKVRRSWPQDCRHWSGMI